MIRDPQRFERLLADTRAIVREVAMPNEARVEREDAIPPEIVATMREMGLFGWSIPQEYGGAGLTTEEPSVRRSGRSRRRSPSPHSAVSSVSRSAASSWSRGCWPIAERFYRDVRAFRIYEGTSQIHQIGIGQALLSAAAQD